MKLVAPVTKPSLLPRQLFCVFVAIAMVGSWMPWTAFAQDEDEEGEGEQVAEEPAPAKEDRVAVKAMNGRVRAHFQYTKLSSDEANRKSDRPIPDAYKCSSAQRDFDEVARNQSQYCFQEESIEQGGFEGILTLPVADQFGARLFVGPEFAKRHIDTQQDTESYGFAMGGDIFWRDPTLGEFGLGPRYRFSATETGSRSESYNAVGAGAYGKAFLPQIGPGPIDLRLEGLYLSTDVDKPEIRRVVLEQTWAVSGDAKLYLSDYVALSAGGHWERLQVSGAQKIREAAGDLGLEILIPTESTAVTLGAGLTVGKIDTTVPDAQTPGQDFFALGLSVTLSFPGAGSLVELNRHYY